METIFRGVLIKKALDASLRWNDNSISDHMSITHHHHSHGNQKRLLITLCCTAAYMVCEVVGGIASGSLALLADASHMLADVAALSLSYVAIWIARKPASGRKTYGYYRMEILAALANGSMLVVLAVGIGIEAYKRFEHLEPINGPLMLLVAVGGLIVNIIGLIVLHRGRQHSLNIHGAWLHIFSDMLGSIGVIISGIVIWIFDWYPIDPLISIIIGLLVVYSSWSLLKETVSILMESAPGHIDPDRVRDHLRAVDGVLAVHDLHIWSITSGVDALSAHVVSDGGRANQNLLEGLQKALADEFHLEHATIQIESENASCINNC